MLKEHPLFIFSGRANIPLTEAICGYLQIEMGQRAPRQLLRR